MYKFRIASSLLHNPLSILVKSFTYLNMKHTIINDSFKATKD